MSHESAPDVARAQPDAEERTRGSGGQPLIRTLANPWVIASAAVAFLLLPRRVKRPLLKAALPLALGLVKAR